MDSARHYGVQAAATLAGINAHTLRAWENRYGAVHPHRTDAGHRVYNARDVDRLKKIASLVRRGHSAGRVASLADRDLDRLLQSALHPDVGEESAAPANLPRFLAPHFAHVLNAAVGEPNPAALSSELRWLRVALGARAFLLQVVAPLFAHIAKSVETCRTGIAQEHALSAVLRDHLGAIFHDLTATGLVAKKEAVVFACAEGDLHEFGSLISAALAAYHGFAAHYLGPNLPAISLADAARGERAPLVVIGNSACSIGARLPFERFLLTLDTQLPTACEVWVGGAGDRPRTALPSRRRLRYVNSLSEIDAMLERRAMRAA